jgi:hypothetical protein
VNEHRFFNPAQPQTMQIAVILLYIDAVLLLIQGGLLAPLYAVLILTMAGGAFGIANEKKWGYALGLFGAGFNLALPFFFGITITDYLKYDPIGLMFSVALVALLVHPMSRDYQRIWFK